MIARFVARFALALLVATGCGVVAKRADAQGAQPSPNSIALAKELIILKGGHKMFDAIVPGTIEQAKNLFLPTNPNLNKPLTEVSTQLVTEYNGKTDELLNEVAKAYATRFSEQELKDLLAFYKSPLGKKMLVEEPAILDQNMKDATAWADKLSNEVISRMRAEMRKRGHEI